jgi:hypothetical protein
MIILLFVFDNVGASRFIVHLLHYYYFQERALMFDFIFLAHGLHVSPQALPLSPLTSSTSLHFGKAQTSLSLLSALARELDERTFGTPTFLLSPLPPPFRPLETK